MNCVWYAVIASRKLPHAHPNENSGNSPCERDIFARYHIGTTKKTSSHAIPGVSSRYGIAPLRRWISVRTRSWCPTPAVSDTSSPAGPPNVFEGRTSRRSAPGTASCTWVVHRLDIELVRVREHLLRREDERVL